MDEGQYREAQNNTCLHAGYHITFIHSDSAVLHAMATWQVVQAVFLNVGLYKDIAGMHKVKRHWRLAVAAVVVLVQCLGLGCCDMRLGHATGISMQCHSVLFASPFGTPCSNCVSSSAALPGYHVHARSLSPPHMTMPTQRQRFNMPAAEKTLQRAVAAKGDINVKDTQHRAMTSIEPKRCALLLQKYSLMLLSAFSRFALPSPVFRWGQFLGHVCTMQPKYQNLGIMIREQPSSMPDDKFGTVASCQLASLEGSSDGDALTEGVHTSCSAPMVALNANTDVVPILTRCEAVMLLRWLHSQSAFGQAQGRILKWLMDAGGQTRTDSCAGVANARVKAVKAIGSAIAGDVHVLSMQDVQVWLPLMCMPLAPSDGLMRVRLLHQARFVWQNGTLPRGCSKVELKASDAVRDALNDETVMVRDAAVELVGRYISGSSDLAVAYFDIIKNASMDAGLSVRKRAVKVIYCAGSAANINTRWVIKLATGKVGASLSGHGWRSAFGLLRGVATLAARSLAGIDGSAQSGLEQILQYKNGRPHVIIGLFYSPVCLPILSPRKALIVHESQTFFECTDQGPCAVFHSNATTVGKCGPTCP
eukprot:360874-Chlamydomonas_euryale.AAC.9